MAEVGRAYGTGGGLKTATAEKNENSKDNIKMTRSGNSFWLHGMT
jgi:hypothetical protein